MVKVLPYLVAAQLLVGCVDRGWIRGPVGRDPLLTARYRVGVRENRPELLLFLSSSAYDACTLPNLDDPALEAQFGTPILLATCRERAQHVLFTAYADDGRWTGAFPHDPTIEPRSIGITATRGARGRYYGVLEAYRLRFDDFLEGYAASEDVDLDPLSEGGTLDLQELRPGTIQGTFIVGGVLGDFVARQCPGDTSLLDTIDEVWAKDICTPR